MTDHHSLIPLVKNLNAKPVLCVGDIMLDRFIYGSISRISPEAPIPVLNIESNANMLGGVGNVVRNIAALGGRSVLLSVIGDDEAGREIQSLLSHDNIDTRGLVLTTDRPTSIKTRYLAGTQQMMRADYETTQDVKSETIDTLLTHAEKALSTCGAVVVSDYGKGVLTENLIQGIIKKANQAGIPVIVDPKGRDYARYNGATIVTPNRAELALVADHPLPTEIDLMTAAQTLVKKHDLTAMLVTRSQDGMSLVHSSGDIKHLPAEAREVFDVSGAGDTVVATIAASLSAGASMEDAARLANVAAGIVVAKVGTATAEADDVITTLQLKNLHDHELKIMGLSALLKQVEEWRTANHEIGFTNGCFDLLHPGHIASLTQSKLNCDKLIVGLNTDSSVRALKGENRPVQDEESRAIVMAALSQVDAVILFSEETPLELITAVKPDVLMKGADYTVDQVVGADVVMANGGRVALLDIKQGHSTTNSLERLNR